MTVQMANEDRMPIGMSRCGFFASCAAVDTASKPMYEKNTIDAPRNTPPQPKWPCPSDGGTNGCQFAGLTNCRLNAMNIKITTSLIATMIAFTDADCVMPT